jgi:hypothetical protein
MMLLCEIVRCMYTMLWIYATSDLSLDNLSVSWELSTLLYQIDCSQ